MFDVKKHFLLIKLLEAKKDFMEKKSYALNVRLLNPLKSSFLSCPQRSFNGGTFSGRLSACVACSNNFESISFMVLSEKVSIIHQPKMGAWYWHEKSAVKFWVEKKKKNKLQTDFKRGCVFKTKHDSFCAIEKWSFSYSNSFRWSQKPADRKKSVTTMDDGDWRSIVVSVLFFGFELVSYEVILSQLQSFLESVSWFWPTKKNQLISIYSCSDFTSRCSKKSDWEQKYLTHFFENSPILIRIFMLGNKLQKLSRISNSFMR